MALAIPEEELRQPLLSTEGGSLERTRIDEPQRIFAGVVEYAASNGGRLAVFCDVNEFDCLE